jgi:hypothetical protein
MDPSSVHGLAQVRRLNLAGGSAQSTDEVMARMRAIDAALDATDGLKWFNLLYITVTESIAQQLQTRTWSDPEWLQNLDVVFANLYFSALDSWIANDGQTPYAWQPLFQARQDARLVRVQFALAGMNAHINRDLCVALVRLAEQRHGFPARDSGTYADFTHVNDILEQAEKQAVQYIATGIVGLIDQALGDIDDIVAMWSVRRARETAWVNGEVLWHLHGLPSLAADYLSRLDRLTGFAGRGLLQPVTAPIHEH